MSPHSIHQFFDKHLSQYGYLIISNGEAAVIDPPRDVQPMLDVLQEQNVTLKNIIETHPHADFVSGHLELHILTGATIHVSKLLGADYEHKSFDTGDGIILGAITLESINTPGHSPDSISILLRNAEGKQEALFSGDTLFVGDVGRPDLRETAGNMQAKREELAGMMYETVHTILQKLPDDTVVYPAHGAGSLCGKALRDAPSTTIGEEKSSNPAFQEMSKEAFVSMLTEGQPFIPQYFPFEVGINKAGATGLQESLASLKQITEIPNGVLVLDTRSSKSYNAGHIDKALHIAENGMRFETWLGTIIAPDEQFVVVIQDEESMNRVLKRIASIGYEQNILGVYMGNVGKKQSHPLDIEALKASPKDYTIVDVRQSYEHEDNPLFAHAMNIPLNELRERVAEIPQGKPIAVHCAGGYRSAVAQSIISAQSEMTVVDIGEHIRTI